MDYEQQMRDHALYYAVERSWYIIPLHHPIDKDTCSCEKSKECGATKRSGKHPRISNWRERATNDPYIIESWFKMWPNMNIGIVTGAESGIIVMDADNVVGKRSILSLDYDIPYTATSKSGEGFHYVFQHPGFHVKTDSNILNGVDSRGDGGFFVACPSLHKKGYRYEWLEAADIAPAPKWWLDLLQKEPEKNDSEKLFEVTINNPSLGFYGKRALEDELAEIYSVVRGTHRMNTQLNRSSYKLHQLVGSGCLDEKFVFDCLLDAAVAKGVSIHEATGTINSGKRAGLLNPRYPKNTIVYDRDKP